MARKENYTRADVEALLERHLEELGPVPKLPPLWLTVLVLAGGACCLYLLALTL